ncbi:hypothetical protein NVP1161O_138 [Vibrio phage 1.161.O._10N.261.48.C5]|nr:hypothetical protein NVP1161O_138 [Vibrio phage 1.161.O._10N.261.48.C5]
MAEERKKLLKEWRDISLWDKICSKIWNTPATSGNYSQAYSDCILDLLGDPSLKVVEVSKHRMVVTVEDRQYEFWTSNYPYFYGNLERLGVTHQWSHSNLNWEAVLKMRELQLQHREEFFRKYDEEQSKL